MSRQSADPDLARAAARPALWIVITLMGYSLLLVIFSGDLTILSVLEMVGSWLKALPGPTEHWATIIAAAAWPAALLLIVYWLRAPVAYAAASLARRFEKADLEIAGLVKLKDPHHVTDLKPDAATAKPDKPAQEPPVADTAEARNAAIVRALLEYAAESSERAGRLKDWIIAHGVPISDVEAFLSDPPFASLREQAYKELVEGAAGV